MYNTPIVRNLGMIMDPIGSINVAKDSSFAMLLAAQRRGWTLQYLTLNDLQLRDQRAWGWMQEIVVQDDAKIWSHVVA